jgi:thiamine-phosphate pyrophosphorylase
MNSRARWPALAHGIYAIIDTSVVSDPVAFGRGLVAGGIRVLQLRAKRGVDLAMLRSLLDVAHAADAVVIVNDDAGAALLADGLHLGQEDAELVDLRILRDRLADKIVGISCGTPDEAAAACDLPADYLGVGAMFATESKADAGPPIGIAGVASVVRASSVPVVAIGGIDALRLSDVRASGAAMAAMISALGRGDDVEARARTLVQAWGAA